MASIYFTRQLTKAYEWNTKGERVNLENFIIKYFPTLENIAEKILSNYSEVTAPVLYEILKAFNSSFHI